MFYCSRRGGTVLVFRVPVLDTLPAHSESLTKEQFEEVEARCSLALWSSLCHCRDTCCHQREAKVGLPLTSGLAPLTHYQKHWIPGCLGPVIAGPVSKQCLPSATSSSEGLIYVLSQDETLLRGGESTIIPSLQEQCSCVQCVQLK